MKVLLIVDIYDEEIPKQPVKAIRFKDGDELFVDSKLISVPEFIDYTFPILYKKIVDGILYGEEKALERTRGNE